MAEIFKSMNGLSPPLAWEFHERKHATCNLRIQNFCKLLSMKTMNFGLDIISFRDSFLWNTLDDSIKREKIWYISKRRYANGLELHAPAKFVDNLLYIHA